MYSQHSCRHHRLYLAIISAPLLAVFSSTAQASEQAVPTDTEMVIYGNTYRNTATKTALEPSETPQGISIVDRETLDRRGTDSVAEALRYVPGVNTQLRGGAVSRLDLFNLRGFINYQNYYDGLQLLYNDWNLQPQIDAIALEQIEVFKGPTSVLYGGMPPGGMVNQIARSPSADSATNLKLGLGSNNLTEASLRSQGQLSDEVNYSVVGLVRKKDGQADTTEEERYLLAPSFDWQVSDQTLVNFNLYYQNDPSMGIFTSLPGKGSLLPNSNGRLSPSAFSGDANWNTYEREQLLVGYKINHQFNDRWTLLHNARFMDADAYQENTYLSVLAADERTLSRRAYLTDEKSTGITIDNQLAGIIDVGNTEHNLLIGLDYLKLDSDIVYKDGVAPDIDLYQPDHRRIDRATLALPDYNSDFNITREQVGIYLQDQVRFDKLIVIAGGRYDSYEATESGNKYGFPTDTTLKQHEFTGRLGALYQLDNGFSPFISYAESFEPQAGVNRNGEKFDPSKGEQIEAGIKYASADGRQNVTLAGFHILKNNVPTRDPNGGPYDQIQAGEVRSQGFELEADMLLTDQLSVFLAYTYTDAEVSKDNNGLQGKTPIWIAEHNASVWANYDISNDASVGLGVRYIGEMEIDASNSDKVPSATLVDLSYSQDLGTLGANLEGASLILSASNLFDKRYYSCYDANNCWFGSERNIKASLSLDF